MDSPLKMPINEKIKVDYGVGTRLSINKDILVSKNQKEEVDRNGFIDFLLSLLLHDNEDQDKKIKAQNEKASYLVEDITFAGDFNAAILRRPKHRFVLVSSVIAVILFIFIFSSLFVPLDEVTHAEGSIVGTQKTQTIGNLEGGILRSIFVHEGQIVEPGIVLAQLDNEIAESSYRDAVNKTIENSLKIIRLEAEKEDKNPEFPTDLKTWIENLIGHEPDTIILQRAQEILVDQINTWKNRREHLLAEIDILQSQLNQHLHEMNEEVSRKAQIERSLQLAIKQKETVYNLVKHRNYSRIDYINLEQRVVDLQGQINQLNITIPKAKAAIEECRQKIVSRRAELQSEISQKINEYRVQLEGFKEILVAGKDKVTRTELKSQVKGTVKQIYIRSVGGVVKAGEPIMDIVPLDDTLLIEAKILPKDIAFLHEGQEVIVKISAYDYHIYGGLQGTLESISADTVEDKMGNYFYIVKVRTKKSSLVYKDKNLPLIPGMIVTADILIGRKTLFDYLMKPILKQRQNMLEYKI